MLQTPSARQMLLPSIAAAFLLLAASASAQTTINAQITGGGGSGKCTLEVRVDGIANVQIRGNQGYIQTKQGMPAQWVRLKCNQPLPRNPYNFRFAGVDGRGKQYMLKDPAQNNGVAIIRIEDNRNGMEGYTGDIMWNGGNNNGGNNNGGWWNDNWNGGGGWGSGSNNGGNWNGGGGNNAQWNNNVVPNCQNTIRRNIQSQVGGANVNFNGSPRTNKAGSFVMVDGNGNARGNNGRQGNFNYRCSMHPGGNLVDSSFNWTGGNLGMQPR